MTLHQLRIFCAVAQAATLTRAGKQLGLAQPTLSQQLSRLEESAGTKLFDRTNNQMVLTDAGHYLLRQAQFILNDVDQAQAGLQEYAGGVRGVVRLAGLNSILRVVLPGAMARLGDILPKIELDIHEVPPAEALDLLYSRSVHIALIAAGSIASQNGISFHQTPVVEDPYVFAVPSGVDLSAVSDPDADLAPAQREIVHRCIQFNFGSQHTMRIAQWYQDVLPRHRLIAQCRSYEVALSMVRAGMGVCLLPALTAHGEKDGSGMDGIDLYATLQPSRRTVALTAAHALRAEPTKSFIRALSEAGGAVKLPRILPTPPFIALASAAHRKSQ